jgi:CubicO group peptidase (beta-lactamase class C family)
MLRTVRAGLAVLAVTGIVAVASWPLTAAVPGFGWSGAFGTHFWVDRKEQLIAIAMTQTSNQEFLRDFENMVTQAVVGGGTPRVAGTNEHESARRVRAAPLLSGRRRGRSAFHGTSEGGEIEEREKHQRDREDDRAGHDAEYRLCHGSLLG